jgi:hypothetical protein
MCVVQLYNTHRDVSYFSLQLLASADYMINKCTCRDDTADG